MKRNPALIAALSLLVPSAAWAKLSMDYYTYDGFSQTVDAFRKVALIFNDHNYVGLFAVIAVLGIFFGGALFYSKALMSGTDNSTRLNLSWLIIPICGAMVFKAMVLPKGTLHIYDEKKNAYEAVGNLPDLIILAAGFVNKIERLVVRIVERNSASPYSKDAGGLSFKLLYAATNNPASTTDFYAIKSLKRYYSDCAPLALVNQNTAFNLETIRSNTFDLTEELAQLTNPAAFTLIYDTSHKSGQVASCLQAWESYLKPLLENPSFVEKSLALVCNKYGFNTDNAQQMIACEQAMNRAIALTYDNNVNFDTFMRNSIIASSIANALQDNNPDLGVRALTNKAMLNEGVGVAMAASSWFPTIKATVTAIILGLLPVLLLFMVTPLFPKVLNLTFCLFAWLALWGICDAMLHQGATDQMVAAFTEIRAHKMGLVSFWLAPEAALKAMAIMGHARSMGITIATFLASVLFGINAYALSSLARGWSAQVDREGKAAAEASQSPQNSAEMIESMPRANATHANMGQFGFGAMSTASVYNRASDISAGMSSTGMQGGNPLAAGHNTGTIQGGAQAGNVLATQNQASEGQGVGNIARDTAMTETGIRITSAKAQEQAAQNLGISGGAPALAGMMSQINQQMAYGQSQSNQTMADMLTSHHPEMSENQAWSALGLYYGTDKIADINATNANVSQMLEYKSDLQTLNMADTMSYLDTVAQLGFSKTDLKVAQGQYQGAQEAGIASAFEHIEPRMLMAGRAMHELRQGHQGMQMMDLAKQVGGVNQFADKLAQYDTATDFARSTALLSVAQGMNITPSQAAISKEGASWSMAVDSTQAQQLFDKGFIKEPQYQALQNGGVLEFGFNAREGLSMVTSTAKTGDSARIDSSYHADSGTQINNQLSIMRGAYTGGGSSSMNVTTNSADIARILAGEHGQRDLALNAAQALANVYDINDSTTSSMGWGVSVGLSTGAERHQKQTINAAYGIYTDTINALYKEADNRGYEGGFKSKWVANEFAQLNQTTYNKFEDLAVKHAGQQNMNFSVAGYFKERGLATAARSIDKNWMHYQFGNSINANFFKD